MKSLLFLLALTLCCSACVSKTDYNSMVEAKDAEIQDLNSKLWSVNSALSYVRDSVKELKGIIEKFETDPSSLKAQAEEAYMAKDKNRLEYILDEIKRYHPDSECVQQVESILSKYEKELIAEQKEQERKAAEEERRNPHTAKGLAKKAARGGWVLGIWSTGYGHYTTIVVRNGSYYMCDLNPSDSDIYNEQRLRLVGEGTYKPVDDDDDAIYVVSPEGMAAYMYGTLASFWEPE